jgi:hypothetical protein
MEDDGQRFRTWAEHLIASPQKRIGIEAWIMMELAISKIVRFMRSATAFICGV